ncbi:MAG: hypothetical protein KC431_01705 [Myxococcales bacterium]|nr:hypothetical protein [Myxococcales bacterium]
MRRTILPACLALVLAVAPGCSSESSSGQQQAQAGDGTKTEAPAGEVAKNDPESAKPADGTAKQEGAEPVEAKPAEVAVGTEPAEAAPEEPGAQDGTAPKEAAKAPVVVGEKSYEVLSEGSGDKALLRFSPKAGQVERMQLTMTMEISMDFGPAMPPQTQKTPPLKMVNKAETLSVADGKITERVTFERFEIDETAAGTNAMMATAMKSAMEQLQGFEQKLVYDERGGVLDGSLTIPADANAQVAQSLQNIGNTLEQVMVRFPEQAIGVGGKWRETTELDNNGLRLEQISEYELDGREGNQITLKTTVEQKPLNKEFNAPGMPPGVKLDLVEFDSKGGGKIVYTLGNMLPDSGSSSMDTKVTVGADANGQKQEFTTRIKLELSLERLEE